MELKLYNEFLNLMIKKIINFNKAVYKFLLKGIRTKIWSPRGKKNSTSYRSLQLQKNKRVDLKIYIRFITILISQ